MLTSNGMIQSGRSAWFIFADEGGDLHPSELLWHLMI
jgi:hypothetical protein